MNRRQKNEQTSRTGNHGDLDRIGRQILEEAKTELGLSLPFFVRALASLPFKMDTGARGISTDAFQLYFNPTWLLQTYLRHSYMVNRTYLHLILHCLFRHMFTADQYPDHELWDLACDICVESVIDSMDMSAVNRVPSDFRQDWYAQLKKALGVLTAERLYRWLSDKQRRQQLPYLTLLKLQTEFTADDHDPWLKMKKQPAAGSQAPVPSDQSEQLTAASRQVFWKKVSRQMESELEFGAGRRGNTSGTLDRVLAVENRKKTDLSELLWRFSVLREEVRIDPETFDLGYYAYGLSVYGNMPLIEENEYAESRKISELVIAIDTSASCQRTLVQEFLNETAAILHSSGTFFRHLRLYILQCDTEITDETVLTKEEALAEYSDTIHIRGGGGTDFRPVFRRVEELRKEGKLRDLKGLLYFTDGFGRYPKQPTPYTTAFVFRRDGICNEEEVPDWAMTVYTGGTHEHQRGKAGDY